MRRAIVVCVLLAAVVGIAAVLIARHSHRPVRHTRPPPPPIASVDTSDKVVALTFDDGPDPRFTPRILKTLKKYHVKATFFMVGERMEKYPDLVRAVAADGHVIGNHTYTHPEITQISHARVEAEISRSQRVIERLTGKRANLFRPPKGNLDDTVLTVAAGKGCRTILWSVSAYHHETPAPKQMAQRVFDLIRPGGIILMHDGRLLLHWRDVAATPMIIEGLRRQRYKFVTVPELLRIGSQR